MGDIAKVLDNLRRQCSRREYCSQDIYKKAEKALDGDGRKAAQVLQTLIDEKYVDDVRYSTAYAREKSSISGWGEVKIRYMLAAKGISKDAVALALAEIDVQRAETRLLKLLENKYRILKEDPQWKLKLLRFALGRGYSYEEVNECINVIRTSHSHDEER